MSGLVGTAQWMAPEVFLSEPRYDSRIDVYSFGVVLWELLTAQVPYEGIDLSALPKLVVNDGLRPELPKDTPEGLANLITSCWGADPKQRPSFQQIGQLLSSPRFVFPGTDMARIATVKHGRTAKLSSPLPFCPSLTVGRARPKPATDLASDYRSGQFLMIRAAEAWRTGNTMLFNEVIGTIRQNIQKRELGGTPGEFVKNMMTLIGAVSGFDRVRLVKLLSEAFVVRDVLDGFIQAEGVALLVELLETRDRDRAALVLAILEASDYTQLFTIPLMRSLFLYANFGDSAIRFRALRVLLSVAKQQRAFLCSFPTFVAHLLDFGMCELPDQLWDTLLRAALDLLSGMESLSEAVVDRLGEIISFIPESHIPLAVRCVQEALRFQIMREHFPASLWEFATWDFDACEVFFRAFLEKPPESDVTFIACLFAAAKIHPSALELLVDFVKFPSLATLVANLLPLNLQPNRTVFRLYSELASEKVVFAQPELYSVCGHVLRTGFDLRLIPILRSDDFRIDLMRNANLASLMSKAVVGSENPDALWSTLSVVHKWCSKGCASDFEPLVPHLRSLLLHSDSLAQTGSLLCLIELERMSSRSIHALELIPHAVRGVCHSTEAIQRACFEFMQRHMTSLHSNDQLVLEAFCGAAQDPSPLVVQTAQLLLQIASRNDSMRGADREKLLFLARGDFYHM
jgi:hypothetical protein